MTRHNSGDQSNDVLETVEQVSEVLNYDPFPADGDGAASPEGEGAKPDSTPAPEAATPSAAAPPAPAPVSPPSAEPAAAPVAPSPAAAPTPPPGPKEPTMAEMVSIVRSLQESNAELVRRLSAPVAPPGAPGAPAAPAEDPVPEYLFSIPDQLFEALRSDDPATQKSAYAYLISGAAQAIHRNMRGALTEALTPVIERRISERTTAVDSRKAMHNDFYGTYKFLDRQELKPLVAATAAQVSREWNTNEWSTQLRDEIFNRVVKTLQSVQGAITPGAPTVPAPGAFVPTPAVLGNPGAPPPSGQPPLILDGGVRPDPQRKGSVTEEVEELLF